MWQESRQVVDKWEYFLKLGLILILARSNWHQQQRVWELVDCICISSYSECYNMKKEFGIFLVLRLFSKCGLNATINGIRRHTSVSLIIMNQHYYWINKYFSTFWISYGILNYMYILVLDDENNTHPFLIVFSSSRHLLNRAIQHILYT